MAERADTLREEAFTLREAGRYSEARARMQEALEKQESLNEEFRNSPHASISRLKRFEHDWRKIEAAEDSDRIRDLIEESRLLLAAGQSRPAQERAESAELLQGRISSQFPDLEEADPAILRSELQR